MSNGARLHHHHRTGSATSAPYRDLTGPMTEHNRRVTAAYGKDL